MTDVIEKTFADEWREWHAEHEAKRADRHGFLAVTGITWLTATPVAIAGIPGVWSTGDDGIVVALGEGEELRVGEQTITGTYIVGKIAERAGVTLYAGDIAIEVAKRGGHDIVRPRDPQFRYLAEYSGTTAYEPDPAWRVDGRFEPYDEPRPTDVGSAAEGLTHVYDIPGEVVFELGGTEHRLKALPGHAGGLLLLFTDETSGVTTYAANRSVNLAEPDADGHTVIDFNRATNLPCAYTDYATCPLPPAGNALAIAVEAGEKTPAARVVASLD